MVQLFKSTKFPSIFYVKYSNTVYSHDDESYWEKHLIPFLNTVKNITFATEYDESVQIVDRDFFGTSKMDKFDRFKHLKCMSYSGLIGIQKSFLKAYINNFPCDYVEHEFFDTPEHFFLKYGIDFEKDFNRVFVFDGESDG